MVIGLRRERKASAFWDGPVLEEGSSALQWFTPEKLTWDRSRERLGISGFDSYREAAVHDMLYVGIARVGDSFDRSIRKGHKARMEILANEPQRLPGARVTDEVYLFLFSVHPTIITSFEFDHGACAGSSPPRHHGTARHAAG